MPFGFTIACGASMLVSNNVAVCVAVIFVVWESVSRVIVGSTAASVSVVEFLF